jgi:hypothetical protein
VKVVEGWAEVARFEDELQADLTARALRAASLEAQVLSQKDRANVVGFGGLAVVRVLVPGHQYQAGIDTLREPGLEDGGP